MVEDEETVSNRLLDSLDELLNAGDFAEVDDCLATLQVETFDPATVLAVLSLTWHAQCYLSRFVEFAQVAEGYFRSALGDERAEYLMRTRRPW